MSSAPRDASVRLGWLLAALPILACACSSSASAPGETADAADVTADVAGGDGSRADTATALEGGADVATDAPTAEVADAATASPFPLVDPPPGFAGLAPSAPLTLTAATGKTLSNLSITNPNGPCIAIHGGADLVLDHVSLGPCKGDGVSIDGHATRVTIRNSYVHDTTGNGVGTYQASGVTLTGSHFARISSGGYFAESTGVIVERCSVLNVQGPFPRGQLAQFNGVTGPSNAIRCNVMENRAGESNPEDGINLYVSSGTAASPIVVEGNRIRGGGPSTSGGGILLGDGGKTSAYQISRFNVLADPGQYGGVRREPHDDRGERRLRAAAVVHQRRHLRLGSVRLVVHRRDREEQSGRLDEQRRHQEPVVERRQLHRDDRVGRRLRRDARAVDRRRPARSVPVSGVRAGATTSVGRAARAAGVTPRRTARLASSSLRRGASPRAPRRAPRRAS
jgi:hypothetical protein